MKRNLAFVFLFFAFFTFGFEDVLGQTTTKGVKLPESSEVGLSKKSIPQTIQGVLNFIFAFVAGLSVLMIVVSSVWYIVSAGDQDATEDATDMLIWAVTGLVVALLAGFIVRVIYSVLGV